ncbi:two component transcriptional regulator [Caballeronia terrestris]|uniref:Two component transcriptional regulator n=1 Tax=Caballeronia terrestris TaxID=1226301 RepID=A0A158KEY7_9BURK|nr:response regulator [Caballeronia terrestris]SAL79120.1 two component transcriptional regulator [Caballeronia terrestris]
MSIVKAESLLIADDDPNLLAAYVFFFGAYGYAIRTAGNGVDALAEYCTSRPVVVVLDIEMPRLDGRAVAREIRRLNVSPAPFLVAVTALSSPYERAESIRSGFDYHFVKPAQLPVILAMISARPH